VFTIFCLVNTNGFFKELFQRVYPDERPRVMYDISIPEDISWKAFYFSQREYPPWQVCKNCKQLFLQEKNTVYVCASHPGEYRNYMGIYCQGMVRPDCDWSCCLQLDESARGCAEVTHISAGNASRARIREELKEFIA